MGKRIKKQSEPSRALRWFLFVSGSLCMGFAAAVASQWIITGSLANGVLPWFLENPGYLLLTGLLYAVITAVIGAVTGWLAVGGIVAAMLSLGLSLVDYFKTAINGTPLELVDFGLATQLGNVAGVAGELKPHKDFWLASAALVLCVVILILLRKVVKLQGKERLGGLGISILLALCLFTGFGAEKVGPLFGVDMYTRTAASVSHDRYGLTVSLWRDCFLGSMERPGGYSKEYMQDVLDRIDELTAGYRTEENVVIPNVIFILSESFFDLTRLPDLTYDSDPLENFHTLQAESISGNFHSHYLGYGTGYLEMAMLQGFTGMDFNPGTNICFLEDESYSLLDSAVEPFLQRGYKAEMLHAFDNSLYNRTVTYPLMGFSDLFFSADVQALDFPWEETKYGGYYLNDRYFFTGMLERMRAINAEGQPAFLYGISMENHQPFNAEKFGYQCQIGVESETLSDEDMAIVRVMLEGITRADQALGMLVEELRNTEESTIVVFFGDHRPNLFMTDGDTVYTKLGLCPENDTLNWSADQINDLYATDYLIWANDPALLNGLAGTEQESSITGLTPQLLDVTGMGWNRWWALQNEIRKVALTDTDLYFVDGKGNGYFSSADAPLTDEAKELLELKKAVTYDAFYGERYITEAMNEMIR